MAKNKKNKKGLQQQTTRSGGKVGLQFGDFPVNDIARGLVVFETSSYLKEIKVEICTAFAVAVWLIQIRATFAQIPAQQIEKIPSYKYLKRKLVNGEDSPVLKAAAIIACLKTAVFMTISTVEEFQTYVSEALAVYSPNSKHFSNLGPSNYGLWVPGFMARHVGLFSSCPASNIKIFNFSRGVDSWGIKDLLTALGPIAQGVEPEMVLLYLSDLVFVSDAGLAVKQLQFAETQISSPLEQEVLSVRPGTQIIRSGTIQATKMAPSDQVLVEKYLTPFELMRFNQAMQYNLPNITSALLSQAKKLAASDSMESEGKQEQDSGTSTSDDPAQGPSSPSPSVGIEPASSGILKPFEPVPDAKVIKPKPQPAVDGSGTFTQRVRRSTNKQK